MAGEIVNMNISLNNINAANMTGISTGVMGNVGAMQSMEAFSAAMTTPGSMEAPSDAMAKLTGSFDGKMALAENASKLNVCNSYLEACNGAKPENASTNGLKGMLNPNGDPAQMMDKCLDKCFGNNISAQEKGNVINYYAKAAAPEASQAKTGVAHLAANTPQVKAPATQATALGRTGLAQAANKTAPAPRNADVNGNVTARLSNQTPRTATRNVASPQAPIAKQPAAQTMAAPENAFSEMLANQPSLNDMMANFDMGKHSFDAGMFKMPDFNMESSVLAQYKQNGENGMQAANLMNEYIAQMGDIDMSAITAFAQGDTSGIAGIMGQNGAVDPAIVSGLRTANNPMDLVGSTAMSTNMAKLENLVNQDLLNDMISGEGLKKA